MNATTSQTRYRWVICALIFLATTINYMDRQILSLLKPILDGQLHWTNQQFGAINSAFQASYGLSVFFFGWFIDRYGTKIGYTVSIAAWSVAAMGHALVTTISGFFGARIALGLGARAEISPPRSNLSPNGFHRKSGRWRRACSIRERTSGPSSHRPSCRLSLTTTAGIGRSSLPACAGWSGSRCGGRFSTRRKFRAACPPRNWPTSNPVFPSRAKPPPAYLM